MLTKTRKITGAIAVGALLFNAFATSAFAANSVTISGNGRGSSNEASVTTSKDTTVTQSNNADISNYVSSNASTGGNTASDNLGGDVLVDTGNATSSVQINNAANINKASIDNCGCASATDVKISGNGRDSWNDADVSNNNNVSAFQTNSADFSNDVYSNVSSGGNDASDNLGASNGGLGMVTVRTGDATSLVGIKNAANENLLNVGGSGVGSAVSGTSAVISGNARDSSNDIDVTNSNNRLAVQDNNADFYNTVSHDASTGYNTASDNLGGFVMVDTHNATAKAYVDNMANFNWANVDCGCTTGTSAKVASNGRDSWNDVTLQSSNDNSIFQDGTAYLGNSISGYPSSGGNDASDNGGAVLNDPVRVFTGDATSYSAVANHANANIVGSSLGLGGFSFSFDLGSLWASI